MMEANGPTLLSLSNVTVKTAAGGINIVDDVSLLIRQGEFLAVVGESGSGKTMLARSVIRLLPPGIEHTAGSIALDGESLGDATPARMRQLRGPGIGMVFQEPMLSLNPAIRIGEQMAEALRVHERLGRKEIRERSLEILRRVQFDRPERIFASYPHEFSGGMRQRIMLASVMMLRPKLLIADEPTTALDTLSQQDVLDLMVRLAVDNGTAVMLITHNLGLVKRYAHRAIVMRNGRVVEEGNSADLLLRPQQDYTKALVAAVPSGSVRRERRAAIGAPAVAVTNLHVTFSKRREIFRRWEVHHAVNDVSLTIHQGEVVAVVGGSGSGKTTLGRAILGLIPDARGSVIVGDVNMLTARGAELRKGRQLCQFIYQDPHASLDPRMRVSQIIGEALRNLPGISADDRRRRVEEALEGVGMSGMGMRYPHALSGGQRQRVAIARAIVGRPKLVVADEPISALDMTVQKQILELLLDLQRRFQFACLFISHDLGAVESIADRVLVMKSGESIEFSDCEKIFKYQEHDYTKSLLEATPTIYSTSRLYTGTQKGRMQDEHVKHFE